VLSPTNEEKIAPSTLFHKTQNGAMLIYEKNIKNSDGLMHVTIAYNVRNNLIRLGRTDLLSAWDKTPITPGDF